MDEVLRVASYIKSCREANIDCTVTIDKSKTHLILNALTKQIPRKVKIYEDETLTCPTCKEELGYFMEDGYGYCMECGQKIEFVSK